MQMFYYKRDNSLVFQYLLSSVIYFAVQFEVFDLCHRARSLGSFIKTCLACRVPHKKTCLACWVVFYKNLPCMQGCFYKNLPRMQDSLYKNLPCMQGSFIKTCLACRVLFIKTLSNLLPAGFIYKHPVFSADNKSDLCNLKRY